MLLGLVLVSVSFPSTVGRLRSFGEAAPLLGAVVALLVE